MSFNNKFFDTKEAAQAFKKRHGSGKLLHYNSRCRESRHAFMDQMMVAAQRRGEVIFPEETPYCVAWNELENEE